MKSFKTILFLLFLSSSSLAFNGELWFQFLDNVPNYDFDLYVSTTEYSWFWGSDVALRVGLYSHEVTQKISYLLDNPLPGNSAHHKIDWGYFKIQIVLFRTNTPLREYITTRTFYLDLRDQYWGSVNYPADTHILIEPNGAYSKFYISRNSSLSEYYELINENAIKRIWEVWAQETFNQSNFKVPVKLINKTVHTTSFGYLWAENETTPTSSGVTKGFYFDGTRKVTNGTLEKVEPIDSKKYYSFKWYAEQVSDIDQPNLFASDYFFTIPILASYDRKITRDFKPVYSLTIKNYLIEENGLSKGTVFFKNPTTTNQFQEISVDNGGSGFVLNEAFEGLDEDINGLPHQQYSLKAKANFIYNNHTYNWYSGDFNPTTATDFMVTGPTQKMAYYKGHLISNSSSAYNPTQRKFARLNNGTYHTYYESMGRIWGTTSSESGYTGQWDEEADILTVLQLPPTAKAKNVSLDIILDTTYIVFEYLESDAAINAQIYYAKFPFNTEDKILIDSYPATYFGQAKPVLARFIQSGGNVDEIYILYRKNSTNGIYYKRKYYNLNTQYYWETGILPNTNSDCLNPALVPIHNNSFTPIHILWQEAGQIRYIYSSTYPARNYTLYSTTPISSGSGYTNNYLPSVSIAGNNSTVVASWTADNGIGLPKTVGKEEARVAYKSVTRVNQNNIWGNFFIAGDNVTNTTNNSTSSSTSESVIAWSENSGANAKWVRRVGTEYSCLFSLSPAGLVPVISNGPDLISTKALVFNQSTLPYVIEKSTTNFTTACEGGGGGGDLGKINTEDGTLYGRRGIVMKNGLEFIFNIGDVVVDDSVMNFVPRPDTIVYSAYSELNEVVRTIPFQLNQNTTFQFSNLYYTLYGELADTALTETDAVSFKVELVNATTQNVVGTFDNITYDKNNLEKYENISYQVNCSGIQPGEYYLRLVTTVTGNAEYNLANVQSATTNIAKKLFTTVYFDGNGLPETFEISQNYPNPFNPTTVINYQIPQDGLVTIKVYDILGKEVATLVNENKSVGRYSVQFNGNNLASGVYIYRINSGDFVSSKKMMLIK